MICFIQNCHRLFDINLSEVDKGIEKIVTLFNERFTDGKTAFIFTADHGMSNKGTVLIKMFLLEIWIDIENISKYIGAHGAGTAHETETPIIAWGAGVNYWKNLNQYDTEYVIIQIVLCSCWTFFLIILHFSTF